MQESLSLHKEEIGYVKKNKLRCSRIEIEVEIENHLEGKKRLCAISFLGVGERRGGKGRGGVFIFE